MERHFHYPSRSWHSLVRNIGCIWLWTSRKLLAFSSSRYQSLLYFANKKISQVMPSVTEEKWSTECHYVEWKFTDKADLKFLGTESLANPICLKVSELPKTKADRENCQVFFSLYLRQIWNNHWNTNILC